MKFLFTILATIPFTVFAQQSKQVKSTPEIGKPNTVIRINCSCNTKEAPLIIVNGFVIEKDELSKVNPDQILSMEIVKSPEAAALYGEKAKYGVITIKVKQKLIEELIESKAITPIL